ncbi:tetratricopeptide (TPR) repeat protein [Plantactinospora soyae]|uniref:Tetratricopeptide (TPR) repeat protein n=2 Tax=Plantactinospora soyae TaxID=1544732 RepID=A0A927R6K3_9ACTN|nr:tetratricopeptide (TPR) repeat protein [Plantactinospora soyae]
MALANVAWLLASSGHRVLAVDWDLESPGLHRFFHPLLTDDPQLHASDGVIDLVRDFAATVVQGSGQPTTPTRMAPDVRRYAVSLGWRFSGGGELDLLPAGRQGPAYSATVSTFDWPSFYDRLGGAAFLAELRQNLRDHYDFVLIDSRTGLSDSAGICTVLLPDTVLNCFTLSTQSIDGAVAVARSIRNLRANEPVRILPVPMRVEDGEQSKLEAGRDYAWLRFAPFLQHLGADDQARYWADVEIPYKLFYAYEEILAVFGDRARQPSTLLAAYERLAAVVGGDLVRPLTPLEEGARRHWLARFERTRPRAMTRALVSYAAEDRIWAEWVAGVMAEVGLPTILREVEESHRGGPAEPEPTAEGADLVTVLLSVSYRLPTEIAGWVRQSTDARERGRSNVLTISLDGTAPPDELERYGVLELSGMPAESARAGLLATLNRPVVEPEGAVRLVSPRFPAPPQVSRLPPRNSGFTGRRQLLSQIRDHLSSAPAPVPPLTLSGIAGVGKSQIATEYAHRFAADYDAVWWISAAQTSMARAGLVDLADELRVRNAETPGDRIRLLVEILERPPADQRWLLVFDNAGDPEELADILPDGAAHVLVTSRALGWGSRGKLIEVGPFGRDESVELLRLRMPALTAQDAEEVARRLGDLPLAVEQAGSWLAATRMPVDRYLTLLDSQLSRLLAENLPAGYKEAGPATWLLSLDRLRAESPAAGRLMELLAFFGPEPIPASLLYSQRLIDIVAGDDTALRDVTTFAGVVEQARRSALATFDATQASVQLHRLVSAVIRQSLSGEVEKRSRRQVHQILVSVNPGDPEQPDTWPTFASLWPHVVAVRALQSTDDDVRQLVLGVGRYLYRRGDFAASAELLGPALEVWEGQSPEDDLSVLAAKIFLANVLRPQARYVDARRLSEEAYQGLLRTVGLRHAHTLLCMAGLAADLWSTGEFVRARDLNREVLQLSTELFDADDHRTLRAMNNLAVVLEFLGDYWEALRLHEQAYQGRRRLLGERFPDTLFSATSHGRVLRLTGDLRASRRVLEAAVAGHREVHGDDQASTMRARVELAATLRRLGHLDAALNLARATYEIFRTSRSETNPDRLACANALALTLSALGNQVEALELGWENIQRQQDVLPETHPYVLAVRGNLAIYLRRNGELDTAAREADAALGGMRTALGDGHPYTLQCLVIAANVRFALDDPAAALELERLAYDGMARIFRDTHPDLLTAGCNLAASRTAVGDLGGLADFRADLVARATRGVGREHPLTAAILARERAECEIDLLQF